MLLDTYEVLEKHNLLSSNRLARKIASTLEGHCVTGFDEVTTNAMLVPEIRVALVGTKYSDDAMYELDEMFGEMTRPKGLVQAALSVGVVLCSTAIRRKVSNGNGVPMVVNKQGRFVSDNADVINTYRWEPAVIRTERQVANLRYMMELDMAQVPALSAFRPAVIDRAHEVVRRELPKGKS